MGNCTICGKTIDGSGLCESCSASHGIGTPEDVPCQRCGMYLPPHELRMWNSRLYCAYCIMDIQDEDARGKEKKHELPRAESAGGAAAEGGTGGLLGGLFGGGKSELQQYPTRTAGTCERCGRQVEFLYSLGGLKLCERCYFEGGGESPVRPSAIGQIVEGVRSALGMKKSVATQKEQAPLVFDVRSRKLVARKKEEPEKREAAQEGESNKEQSKKEALAQEKNIWKSNAPSPPGIFDIQDRRLVEKKEGMEGQAPMAEERHAEKKPSIKAKKFFFKLHPGEGEKGKRK